MAIRGRSHPTNRSVQVIRSAYFDTPLAAAFGSYTLTGQAVTFDDGLLASAGSYTLTGEPATFSLTTFGHVVRPVGLLSRPKPSYHVLISKAPPVVNNAVLVAGTGSYTLTGQAVTFDNGLSAAFGSYTLTGEAATFNGALVSAFGSYTLTGEPATTNETLVSAFGSYTLTGEAATTDYALGAAFGSYVLTGNAATLVATGSVTMPADFGSYSLTGLAATLIAPNDTSGQTVLMPGPAGPAFTRKRFRELMDAIRAAEAAADKAKQRARQKALNRAAEAARKLQDEAEATEAEFNPEPIRKALEAASGAKKLQDAIEQSKQVVEMVAAMLRAAEEGDEEEAVSLLLMS